MNTSIARHATKPNCASASARRLPQEAPSPCVRDQRNHRLGINARASASTSAYWPTFRFHRRNLSFSCRRPSSSDADTRRQICPPPSLFPASGDDKEGRLLGNSDAPNRSLCP